MMTQDLPDRANLDVGASGAVDQEGQRTPSTSAVCQVYKPPSVSLFPFRLGIARNGSDLHEVGFKKFSWEV